MDNKILEIFIPGPAGRLEAKYYKSKKNTSPINRAIDYYSQKKVTFIITERQYVSFFL